MKELFDRMGPTYSATNLITSFGFSEFWRKSCVVGAGIKSGTLVCDMMAGSGECWRHIRPDVAKIISIDFSKFMNDRQRRKQLLDARQIDVICENATSTSLGDGSVDHVVSAFGLKTLSEHALASFASELMRILKPGGSFSLLEISMPRNDLLRVPYSWYISSVIPAVGKLLLGDIDCYRMLGAYTRDFQSCERLVPVFRQVGLTVSMKEHFFGCATSLVGTKNA
ncbi:MAG: class I SAM-dependent methyltransferase [Verrucomicrobiota bacterium]